LKIEIQLKYLIISGAGKNYCVHASLLYLSPSSIDLIFDKTPGIPSDVSQIVTKGIVHLMALTLNSLRDPWKADLKLK
jgi:hypothetical protein